MKFFYKESERLFLATKGDVVVGCSKHSFVIVQTKNKSKKGLQSITETTFWNAVKTFYGDLSENYKELIIKVL